MGNSPATLGIRTDQTSYVSGSTVTGRVYLSVNQADGVRASSLNLRLTGNEIAVVHHTRDETRNEHGHRNTRRSDHYDRRTSSVLHLDVPLATFSSGVIDRGQYEFPFEVMLPEGLPGTMYERRGESKCEVRYEIGSRLVKTGGDLFGNWNNAKSSQKVLRIVGTPRVSGGVGGVVVPPETVRVKEWCCINKGTMAISSEIDRCILSPGESTQVSFQCKNESTVPVSCVKIKFRETVSWQGHHHNERVERVLCEQSITGDSIPELARLHKVPKRYFGGGGAASVSEGYESLSAGYQKHQETLILPWDAKETFRGSLIEVRHTVTVTLKTSCCISSPESCILVQVQSIPTNDVVPQGPVVPSPSAPPMEDGVPEAEVSLVLPPDWSAVTAEVVSVPMAQATIIGPAESTQNPYSEATAPPTDVPPRATGGIISARPNSLEQIETDLGYTSNQYDLMVRYTSDSALVALFQNLTPDEYASLILKMNYSMDQPQIAKMIAQVMDEHFICEHVRACAILLSPINKMDVIREVAPLASDVETNKSIVEGELDSMELLHYRAAFQT